MFKFVGLKQLVYQLLDQECMQRFAGKHWRAITLGAYVNADDHSWLSTNLTVYDYGFLEATRKQKQCVLQLPPLLATPEL